MRLIFSLEKLGKSLHVSLAYGTFCPSYESYIGLFPIRGAIPENPSSKIQVALDWLTAVALGDIHKLASLFTDDFVHSVYPPTLNLPSRNKQQWLEYNKVALTFFKDYTTEVKEIVEGRRTVVLHTTSSAVSSTGALYNNEYVIFVHLTEDANGVYRIMSIKEFIDTLYSAEFSAEEKKRYESMGKKFNLREIAVNNGGYL
ncbi:unnamed protein product [Somion occarium]|uniref:SnoaL-like domain-containing protein n=1 Tax=Somion occarium TaxID=3059160 RepID=A0ABP1ED21_9APHY